MLHGHNGSVPPHQRLETIPPTTLTTELKYVEEARPAELKHVEEARPTELKHVEEARTTLGQRIPKGGVQKREPCKGGARPVAVPLERVGSREEGEQGDVIEALCRHFGIPTTRDEAKRLGE